MIWEWPVCSEFAQRNKIQIKGQPYFYFCTRRNVELARSNTTSEQGAYSTLAYLICGKNYYNFLVFELVDGDNDDDNDDGNDGYIDDDDADDDEFRESRAHRFLFFSLFFANDRPEPTRLIFI